MQHRINHRCRCSRGLSFRPRARHHSECAGRERPSWTARSTPHGQTQLRTLCLPTEPLTGRPLAPDAGPASGVPCGIRSLILISVTDPPSAATAPLPAMPLVLGRSLRDRVAKFLEDCGAAHQCPMATGAVAASSSGAIRVARSTQPHEPSSAYKSIIWRNGTHHRLQHRDGLVHRRPRLRRQPCLIERKQLRLRRDGVRGPHWLNPHLPPDALSATASRTTDTSQPWEPSFSPDTILHLPPMQLDNFLLGSISGTHSLSPKRHCRHHRQGDLGADLPMRGRQAPSPRSTPPHRRANRIASAARSSSTTPPPNSTPRSQSQRNGPYPYAGGPFPDPTHSRRSLPQRPFTARRQPRRSLADWDRRRTKSNRWRSTTSSDGRLPNPRFLL